MRVKLKNAFVHNLIFFFELIRFSCERLQKLVHGEIDDVACSVGALNATRWKARVTGHRAKAMHRGIGQLSLRVLRKGQCRVGSHTGFRFVAVGGMKGSGTW